MGEVPAGTVLERLLAHRRRKATDGAKAAEVDAVLAGCAVGPTLVRRLAPVLGLHAADLFVIAALDLPEDLAPAGPGTPWNVGSVLEKAATFTGRSLHRLHEFVRALPQRSPTRPPDPLPGVDPREPGALLVGLLLNRGIRPHNARMLLLVGDGPYVSDSTVAMLEGGRVALTPRHLTAFAAVLGIPAADLSAMTGVEPASNPWVHPYRAELAALAWDARRLTADQLSETVAFATDLGRTDRELTEHRCEDHHPALRHALRS
jgi:transcriptional regulator with XRE-family HTH domain